MKEQFVFKGISFEVYSNEKRYGARQVQYFSVKQIGSYEKPAQGQWSHAEQCWIAQPGNPDFNQAIAIAAGLVEAPKVVEEPKQEASSSTASVEEAPKVVAPLIALVNEDEEATMRAIEEREAEEIRKEHFEKYVLLWENSRGQEIRVEYVAAWHAQAFYEVRVGNARKERYSSISTSIPAKFQAVAKQHGIVAMLGNVGLTAERRDALLAMTAE